MKWCFKSYHKEWISFSYRKQTEDAQHFSEQKSMKEEKKKAYRYVNVCVCACLHTHAIILSALNLLAFKDEKKKMYVCTQVNKVLLEQITQH